MVLVSLRLVRPLAKPIKAVRVRSRVLGQAVEWVIARLNVLTPCVGPSCLSTPPICEGREGRVGVWTGTGYKSRRGDRWGWGNHGVLEERQICSALNRLARSVQVRQSRTNGHARPLLYLKHPASEGHESMTLLTKISTKRHNWAQYGPSALSLTRVRRAGGRRKSAHGGKRDDSR